MSLNLKIFGVLKNTFFTVGGLKKNTNYFYAVAIGFI